MATNDASTPGMLLSTSSGATPPDRKIYAALAKRLLETCPIRQGGDPEVFITAIVTILMHYPVAIVEEVVDPFFGLPARLKFPPTPYDVKQACDALMPSKTKSWSEAWDDRSRVQLEERKRLGLEPPPKKTMREIEDDCAAHGIFMSGWKARQRTTGGETPESVRAKSGLTREQWDAIPDAKLVDQWIPAPQWGAAALERAKSSGASQCPPAPERDPRPSPAPLTASGLDAFDRL